MEKSPRPELAERSAFFLTDYSADFLHRNGIYQALWRQEAGETVKVATACTLELWP